MRSLTLALLASLLLVSLHSRLVAADPALIRVNAARDVAEVPRRLFGTNLRQNMQETPAVRQFLKDTGITLFRYPDSIDHTYTWDWENGVMLHDAKPMISKLAKFDNAVALAREIKAEMFFTLNIHSSTPEQAARWVEEARKRGMGGSYWCFGNEPYFKSDKHYLPREAYAEMVQKFAPLMKKADPQIRLGIAWGGPYIEELSDKGRDSFILNKTKQWIDFVDFHFYTGRWDKQMDAKRIMAGSMLVKTHLQKFREIIRREAPEKADRIEIQYWEWNGPPWPQVGGIQTLATGLFAADALGEMARGGVKAAIQYNLQEHACGLIPGWEQDRANSWATETWNGKTIRPIAYAIQIWSREMGPMLVDSAVSNVGSFQTKDWHTLVNFQGEVPLMSVHATRGADRKSLQILIVNKDEKPTEAQLTIEGFSPKADAEMLLLTGPSALSHNDEAKRQPVYHSFRDAPEPTVKLIRSEFKVPGANIRHTFGPHSLTVLLLKVQ